METLQPKLRFPEYNDDWKIKSLGDIGEFIGGGTPSTSNDEFWNGDINWFTPTEIKKDYVDDSLRRISELGLQKSSAKLLPIGTILLTTRATIGDVAIATSKCTTNQGFQSLVTNEFHHNYFIFNWFKKSKHLLMEKANGSTFPEISKSALEKITLYVPSLEEQTRIANFLSSVDEKLNLLKEKKSLLEDYKKGIMQKIFNQEIRFKDDNGNDFEDWDNKTLGECLSFEQPTKYLVNSTDYNDNFETPVLTAGKTFILGYTDEVNGIFKKEDLPVIIFDDFTTATQFVDFPFKAKSSAMKILKAKENINIKFVYEAMQNLKFEVGGHGRHWISIYSNLFIDLPSLSEQTKIANFLSAIDEKIELVSNQIQDTQEYKKGLLQQMFV